MNRKVDFEKLEWVEVSNGMLEKSFSNAGKKLRVVEISQEFHEADWCKKGHIGVVLNGSLEIEFDGRREKYEQGDGIFILAGEVDKHKAKVSTGKARLVFMEDS